MTKREVKQWYKDVYKPMKNKKFKSTKWLKLRQKVLDRDMYECQMCNSLYVKGTLQLQAHHLKPRKCGGKDTMGNLISLCIRCHDIAEEGGFSKADILSYNKEVDIKEEEVCQDLDWRKWVYGGKRRPTY